MRLLYKLFALPILIWNIQILTAQVKPQLDIQNAPAPLFRDPVFDGAADPSIIWNDKTAEWWIFYTQRRASLDLPGVEFCYGTDLGIAVSADQGRTWHYRGTAQLPNPDQGKIPSGLPVSFKISRLIFFTCLLHT